MSLPDSSTNRLLPALGYLGLLLALLLTLLLVPLERAAAQAIGRPADERPEFPEFDEASEQEPILPPVTPADAPREEISDGPAVFVAGYRIAGSSVFSQEALQQAVAPWSGRKIHSEDLVAVRNAITNLYVAAGYVNSGAILGDQEVASGIVELQIVEGSLDEILITGNEHFRDDYLRDRIALGAATPLNLRDLEAQLQILQLDPRIRRVAARLEPGARLGDAVLHLDVTESSRWDLELHVGNYEPPSIGEFSGQIQGIVDNLAGWGDRLLADFTASGGLLRVHGRYEIPFTRWDTRFVMDARWADADVVESGFADAGIGSNFQSYRAGVFQPFYRSPRSLIQAGLVFDWRRTNTFLGGEPFGFLGSGADEYGQSTASVLRLQLEWLYRDPSQVLAARSQLSFGLDALGATRNPGDEPDGQFVAWLLQLQWAKRVGNKGAELILRTDLQLASAPLLTMEQIAVGGYATVRGYRQNQYVRDQAVVASAETRLPLWRHPKVGAFFLAPFVDYAYAWNPDRVDDRREPLASLGLGLRWNAPRRYSARIYWGKNLSRTPTSGSLQDAGLQFLISGSFP